jgi:ABC-2 type transport system ATP-binding protein
MSDQRGGPAIETVDLVRTFRRNKKDVRAVDGLNLCIERGELFGLLGPNGAGKTTTIKILMTTLLPTLGVARVNGLDVVSQTRAVRRQIGFVFGGDRGLYDRLTARDNLRYFADLYAIEPRVQRTRIPELLDRVGLAERAKDRVETFSRGMKQRLHIARGLLHDPSVIMLDEPSNGLDPVGARDLRTLIGELVRDGRTVLLTTHYMHEAELLCGRLAVIAKGRLITTGTPAELTRTAVGASVLSVELRDLAPGADSTLRALPGVVSVSSEYQGNAQILHLYSNTGDDLEANVGKALGAERIAGIRQRPATLEDAYVTLVSGA